MVTNGSNRSYLEATLATPTRSDRCVTDGRSDKALHQCNHSIPTPYIIGDSQSIVDVFFNSPLIWNIRKSGQNIHLSCNAGTIPVNQVINLPGYEQL